MPELREFDGMFVGIFDLRLRLAWDEAIATGSLNGFPVASCVKEGNRKRDDRATWAMMGKKTNKFGLSRDIPSLTMRAIRKECGFGCVLCGTSIYQYEHIDPEWHKATSHAVSAIALLCGTCHDKVTRHFISKARVAAARKTPIATATGYSRTKIDTLCASEPFTVALGACEFVSPRTVLRVFGTNLLEIREPETPGGPIRLSAAFFGKRGEETMRIVDNEYLVHSGNWDVEAKSGRIVIRDAPRSIVLKLDVSRHQMVRITKLAMQFKGVGISCNPKGLLLKDTAEHFLELKGHIIRPECAVEVHAA